MTATSRDGRSGCCGPPSCSLIPQGPARTSAVTASCYEPAAGAPPGPPYAGQVATMLAWAVDHPGPIDGGPLVRVERPVPEPGPGQVRVRVRACGVCRTD